MTAPQTVIVKQRGGCVDALILIIVFAAVVFGGCTYCGYKVVKTATDITKETQEKSKKDQEIRDQKEKTEIPHRPAPPVLTIEPQPITTFEKVTTPITLVSIEEFSLLDKTGKLTTIPSGSIITVESRGKGGTLSMRINGEPFVGSEERLAGNVKEKLD